VGLKRYKDIEEKEKASVQHLNSAACRISQNNNRVQEAQESIYITGRRAEEHTVHKLLRLPP
jgi:hypothetical protein